MAKRKQPINPFYAVCVVVGVAFTITACGYVLLMLRSNAAASPSAEPQAAHPLMDLLGHYGATILAAEVALLGVVSIAAIMLDHYRGKWAATKPAERKGP